MKKKTIWVGVEDFREVVEGNYYYVDKTLFIEDIIEKGGKVTLVTRPRRFGKTLNMSTLKYFFDIDNAESNRELFRGLNIEKAECFMEHQGKYPVIHLNMKELGDLGYDEFFLKFKTLMRMLFNNYEYLRVKLNESDLMYFDEIWLMKKEVDYSRALLFLSEQLYRYHGVKPVLLIDEYDAPMMAGDENGYYEKVNVLIDSFYGNALKGGCSSFAVVTGVLKVAKESIFSTLNNLEVSTILTGDFKQFGMSEKEVIEALKYFGWETTSEETKNWYNGYLFGEERVYNPWSVMRHCENGILEGFWIGTSANRLIKKILRDADREITDTMYTLLKEGRVLITLDDNMILGEEYSNETLMYLMISAGYLTIESRGESRKEYYLKIPNYEVKEYFAKTFKEIATSSTLNSFSILERALLKGEMEEVEELIEEMFLKRVSYLDLGEGERFYHGLILSMILGIDSKFEAYSNRESGLGRYDLAIEPKDKKGVGYIFEFKSVPKKDRMRIERATTWENEEEQEVKLQGMMDNLGMEALAQIDRKLYDTEMRGRGVTKITKIGMVFCGKRLKLYVK